MTAVPSSSADYSFVSVSSAITYINPSENAVGLVNDILDVVSYYTCSNAILINILRVIFSDNVSKCTPKCVTLSLFLGISLRKNIIDSANRMCSMIIIP